jgi:hypothetical protein
MLDVYHKKTNLLTYIQLFLYYFKHHYKGLRILKVALSDKIVNFCYPKNLSDMIDALIKRVSVTYKCYEMYAHR